MSVAFCFETLHTMILQPSLMRFLMPDHRPSTSASAALLFITRTHLLKYCSMPSRYVAYGLSYRRGGVILKELSMTKIFFGSKSVHMVRPLVPFPILHDH